MIDHKDTYVIMGKENCRFCKDAKNLLEEKQKSLVNISFDANLLTETIYWSENGETKKEHLEIFLKDKEHNTVPIIFRVSEKGDIKFPSKFKEDKLYFIGGFDNLKKHFQTYHMSMSRKSTKRRSSRSKRHKAKVSFRSQKRSRSKTRKRKAPKKSRKKQKVS